MNRSLTVLNALDPGLVRVPCVIFRGGTSRAVFFRRDDVPPAGPALDAFLLKAMGSPHIRQIDGLGGAHPATSKVAIVGPSDRPEFDVDFTFAQVDIVNPRVDYSGLCGNISAAVGPFAIDSGMLAATGENSAVRIFNTNTQGGIRALVQTRDGGVVYAGDYAIDGVPGTGAKIVLDYSQTGGSFNGRLLPTGKAIDVITMENGDSVEITICDMVNPVVFVRASDLGATGLESPTAIEADSALIERQREVRGNAAKLLGLAEEWRSADTASPVKPYLIMVAPPCDSTALNGDAISGADIDLHARVVFMNRSHETMAGSGSLCLAVAARIPGSVVAAITRPDRAGESVFVLGHPSGSMEVEIDVRASTGPDPIEVLKVGIGRTARPVMDGSLILSA